MLKSNWICSINLIIEFDLFQVKSKSNESDVDNLNNQMAGLAQVCSWFFTFSY